MRLAINLVKLYYSLMMSFKCRKRIVGTIQVNLPDNTESTSISVPSITFVQALMKSTVSFFLAIYIF